MVDALAARDDASAADVADLTRAAESAGYDVTKLRAALASPRSPE